MTTRAIVLMAALAALGAGTIASQTTRWHNASGWAARQGHVTLEFSQRMWVIGGSLTDGKQAADVWSSADGANWTLHTQNAGFSPRAHHAAAVFNNRMYIFGGDAGGYGCNDVWSSPDGTNWTLETSAAAWTARRQHTVTVFNGELYLLGGRPDGYNGMYGVNDMWTSADGINWTQGPAAAWTARHSHSACVFNGRLLVMGGSDFARYNAEVWSFDGQAWTQLTAQAWTGYFGPRMAQSTFVYNGQLWSVGGIGGWGPYGGQHTLGDVWSTQDGITWTCVTTGYGWADRGYHSCAVLDGRIWVLGGLARFWSGGIYGQAGPGECVHDVWSTQNGVIWTRATAAGGFDQWPERAGHSALAFNNRLWVMGGWAFTQTATQVLHNDVWYSHDGANWTSAVSGAAWSARHGHASVEFNAAIWVIGGNDGTQPLADVWLSTDGANWTQSTGGFPARQNHTCVVFQNKLWVIGGRNGTTLLNDVWSSPDGANWTQETASAGFSARSLHSALVFDNRIWVLAGNDGLEHLGDVWSSQDGIHWTQEVASAPWAGRSGQAAAVAHGRIWMCGGMLDYWGRAGRDVWCTEDGVNWAQEPDTDFSARLTHTLVSFGDRLFMLGGRYGTNMVHGKHFPVAEAWSCEIAPRIISTPAATIVAGQPYTYDVLTDGSAAVISAAGLPAWLTLQGNRLSGTPLSSDVGLSGVISVTASNAAGQHTQDFQVDVIGVPPQITSTPVTTATAGQPYSYTVVAVGPPPAPVLSVFGLPGWLTFDASSGLLSGTPGGVDVGLSALITIVATNGAPPDATQSFRIAVAGVAPVITSTPATSVIAFHDYHYTVAATGMPSPGFTCGPLPAWLQFDSATATFVGTPVETGIWTIEVTADNGWGTHTQQFQLSVVNARDKNGPEDGSGCAGQPGANWLILLAMVLSLVIARAARLPRPTR